MGQSFCFGCSPDNPIGLHLDCFPQADGTWATYFTPTRYHESYAGIMHGGLVITILDELIGNHLLKGLGQWAVTARLEVRFRKPIPIGARIKFVSRIVREKGSLFQVAAWAELPDGRIAVEAMAEMMARETGLASTTSFSRSL
ncbi:HotDog domain [Moorella glycerini]|uniref:Acyl-coenzyme A thioesterase THEM4 n=1 Tax=Neomoorella stamsii TaxID=1266720 RepID=A0A9X7P7J4_9FIRM|nr:MULTISPECIES: hotdog fold domain-containing protein [Moorella]PRR77581.1 Thioesterase superfamily protein [Moorella stamsii]CEP69372.1 HotDog domain [Moorella glycerini]